MGDDEQISPYQIWDNINWCRGTLTNSNLKYIQIALSHKYKTKEVVKLNLFNYVLALFHAKFVCNSGFRNPVFRWE